MIDTSTETMRKLVESAKASCGIHWPGPFDGGKRNAENSKALLLGAAKLCGERDQYEIIVRQIAAILGSDTPDSAKVAAIGDVMTQTAVYSQNQTSARSE